VGGPCSTLGRRLAPAALALLLAVLSGCGFQLRGQVALPEDLRAVFVSAPVLIADELEVFLASGGARVTPDREAADARISASGERFDRRLLSVDPDTGREREFELVYTVWASATRRDGSIILSNQPITLVRDFVFDPAAVLGTGREEAVLYDEMRRDAARQIVRRIEAALRS
jgi:LPS-assembly lipoprotein